MDINSVCVYIRRKDLSRALVKAKNDRETMVPVDISELLGADTIEAIINRCHEDYDGQ